MPKSMMLFFQRAREDILSLALKQINVRRYFYLFNNPPHYFVHVFKEIRIKASGINKNCPAKTIIASHPKGATARETAGMPPVVCLIHLPSQCISRVRR